MVSRGGSVRGSYLVDDHGSTRVAATDLSIEELVAEVDRAESSASPRKRR